MKHFLLILAVVTFATGCRTSTIESRRQERQPAYEALAPEIRSLVDQGQIKVGMPMEAVYIAWGPASEVLQAESDQGRHTVWLYHGSVLQEMRYWSYREVRTQDGVFLERYLDRDYNPQSYVRAEIVFQDGLVKSWRTLPRPH